MKYVKSIMLLGLVFVSIHSSAQQKNEFMVRSSGVGVEGTLSVEYTGEGEGVSMPLEWFNAPKGTKCFAISLWHIPHVFDSSEVKSYWVVYNIPSSVTHLPKGAKGVGSDGYNDKNQRGYDPMKSKGPGVKEYHLTVYALSDMLVFEDEKVYRANLLKAIEGKVLGESTLTYTYETAKTGQKARSLRGAEERGTEILTEVQKEKMLLILSEFNADTLAATEAKLIHEAFREAGLKVGPAADHIIREAGFDPDKLRNLAPPPDNAYHD